MTVLVEGKRLVLRKSSPKISPKKKVKLVQKTKLNGSGHSFRTVWSPPTKQHLKGLGWEICDNCAHWHRPAIANKCPCCAREFRAYKNLDRLFTEIGKDGIIRWTAPKSNGKVKISKPTAERRS